jgi:universal stress protein F
MNSRAGDASDPLSTSASMREDRMSKTVIVPIHLAHTERAGPMLAAAKQLGGAENTIVLVNVIEDVPGYVAAEMPAGFQEQATDAARKELRAIARDAGMELPVEVRRGHAANAILEVAQERKADVIVIASHLPGMQDYFLGSTAARVVRHATCSVYVIR